MTKEMVRAQGEPGGHDKERDAKRERGPPRAPVAQRVRENEQTFRPEHIHRHQHEGNQVDATEGRQLPEGDAGGLRITQLVPVEAAEKPVAPPFQRHPQGRGAERVEKDAAVATRLPRLQKTLGEEEPERRIEREIRNEKNDAEKGDVADPPERRAEINQPDEVAVAERPPPDRFAAAQHPPGGHEGDPGERRTGKRRQAPHDEQAGQRTPPPAKTFPNPINHAGG
jgi:hypothetical protein